MLFFQLPCCFFNQQVKRASPKAPFWQLLAGARSDYLIDKKTIHLTNCVQNLGRCLEFHFILKCFMRIYNHLF